MEIMRFYKQKRILHKYVRWMYDLLADGRFYHLQRASKIKDLPSKWDYGDQPVRYLERMYHCADTMTAVVDWNTGDHRLQRGFFCGDRVCPVCAIKRSLWEYSKLTWQMEHFQEEYTYYFLTLTLPNNPDGFREEINLMSSLLKELGDYLGYDHHKGQLRLCEGFFGSYEITKSAHGWHPHLHLILAYPKKYICSTPNIRKYIDRNGRERVFVNELVVSCGKKKITLSHDSIMKKYIELVKARTDKYNDRLEDFNFLNIGFQPCYNIEQGVNELTKYLIDFEALTSADELFTYLYDSYGLRQRVRRGIFRWTPEVKAAHRAFLDELHAKDDFYFIQSANTRNANVTWYGNSYMFSTVVIQERQVEFTDRKKRVAVLQRIKCTVNYDNPGSPRYDYKRLPDKIIENWQIDIPQTVSVYEQVQLE